MPTRELKINGVEQDVVKLGSSFLVSSAKKGTASNPQNTDMVVKLSDDNEVRGFGQPIMPGLSADIALQYIKKSEKAWELLNDIDTGVISDIDEIKDSQGFEYLLSFLNPKNHVVSGVFGKEIILQILAAKNCEGIRYTIGEMKKINSDGTETNELTIVIMGVKDVTPEGTTPAISEPIAGWEYYQQGVYNPAVSPDGEVHGNSLTRRELLTKIRKENFAGNDDDIIKILFGAY